MKKRLIFILLLLSFLIPALLTAEESGLENLQFSITIKDLNSLSTRQLDELAEKGDWFLLDGIIAGMTLYSAKDEEYLLDVLLMQGEWIGLEEVRKYDCHLIFQGEQWRDLIPDKTPRKPEEGQILLNAKVLVLAQVLSYERTGDRILPYLMVEKIRELP
ncbi:MULTISPECIES: hypothetical protein [unclassified Oceanispirochaeta]|uniref:hypothetical protein n=1 Tax=unclassified Oceanispirochaeta TaxID=2635722 RepID=UPI000E092F92|nr:MULTISPECIES: hypothetical protein [unclassified Oceanispirochaeta]MBF9015249.1 hypothetical protein [Oceanispirochaeta sp. M2]NPD71707.1 hypothetical protein [Oceanispirochaeta sp. M1]RDG32901.1 hypothetical protein DV872_06320 [Oceanispirochaeta sp. M1]